MVCFFFFLKKKDYKYTIFTIQTFVFISPFLQCVFSLPVAFFLQRKLIKSQRFLNRNKAVLSCSNSSNNSVFECLHVFLIILKDCRYSKCYNSLEGQHMHTSGELSQNLDFFLHSLELI